MKKLLAVTMAATMVLGLAGCGQKNESTPAMQASTAKETSEEKVTRPEETTAGESARTEKSDGSLEKILFLRTHNSNSSISYMGEVSVEVANENGFEYDHLTASSDEAKQLFQVEQGIASKEYVGVVCGYTDEGVTLGLKEAKEAGVFVMASREGVEDNAYVNCIVVCNLAQTGYEAISLEVKKLGGAFNLAIVNSSEEHGVTMTAHKEYDKTLAEYPNISVVFGGAGNWNAEDAVTLTETWFPSGIKIDDVACMNDGMATGIRQVMKDNGVLGTLPIYSDDCELGTLDVTEAGERGGSLDMNAQSQCEAAVEAMKTLVTDGTLEEEEIRVDPLLITKESLQEYRESHGGNY